jgi:16S rRNA processing protein RimM
MGVEDRNSAEELRGYKLLVPKSDRPQLTEDEYHVSDLLDLEVYNQLTGEKIGIISDIFWAGNDLLEVKLERQTFKENIEETALSELSQDEKKRKNKPKQARATTVLIPFVKEIVPVVDIEGGRMEITPPPGLLEVNES